MTDNLRDRIAAAITQVAEGRAVYELTNADASVMADVVIDALKKEYGSLDSEMGGCLYDEGEKITVFPGEKLYYRYITDWIEVK